MIGNLGPWDGFWEIAMKNNVSLEPVSAVKRRRIRYARDQRRNIWTIWTLILGGCTMTYMAITVALKLYLPF